MIRSKTMEIRETDLETANNLLKDPHWTFVTAVVDNNAQKVKYVLKRKGTYDDGSSNNSKVDIDLTVMAENALKRAVKFKIFYNGIKINNAVYTFGKPEDMWKYVGETVNVIGNQVFDSRGNFIGRVNKQFKIIGRNIDD